MFDSMRELYDFRGMVRNLVKREIRGRYKGSVLGFLWNFITPLVQILVYILVFTSIFKPGIDNYAIYLTVGMIAWILFSESITDSSGTMVANSDLLKKIYFPRSVLPLSIIFSKVVNYLITLAILFIIIAVTGFGVNWVALLTLPLVLILFLVFIMGLGLALSALNVYFRDVQYIVTVVLMAWIWLTPIMYVRDSIDNALLNAILTINPMTYFIQLFQDVLYWQAVPGITTWLICLGLALASIILGSLVFKHLEKDFAEVL